MKYIIYILFFFPWHIYAQNSKHDVLNPDELKAKEIKLEAERLAPSDIKLPFSKIKIIDSRFDTSKVGYIPSTDFFAGKKSLYKKLVFNSGIAHSIENYYNDYYAASFSKTDFELLIVMKKFWVSGNPKGNNKRMELNNSVKDNTGFYCKWEYYLGKYGEYLPVKRIDTIMVIDESIEKYIDDEFSEKKLPNLKFALKYLIEILDYSKGIEQFVNQPGKKLADIIAYNRRTINMPVLQNNEFKRGVYLSFEEFRNNRPSITEFQEKTMKYRLINSEKFLEDGSGQTISNYWGYSDGKEFRYGMMGNEKIFRIQNTFGFFIKVEGYVINSGNATYNNSGSGINTTSKNKYQVWVPYQLDMETGEVY